MSERPRYAADGRLRPPERLALVPPEGRPPEYAGVVGERDQDPFERTPEDLLLAESFARVDLAEPASALPWLTRHGAVGVGQLFPEDAPTWQDPRHGRMPRTLKALELSETPAEIAEQQANVRWHLDMLARLSEHRDRAGSPDAGWTPHEGWDPVWAQPALRNPEGDVLWLGGATRDEARIPVAMQEHPAPVDRELVLRWSMPPDIGERELARWWRHAHSAWREIERTGVSVLWVPSQGWYPGWSRYDPDGVPDGRAPRGRLSSDWHGMLELQRRLIEPFVVRASERELSIARAATFTDPASGPPEVRWEQRLYLDERRRWRSVLAPIYLQLLEALLRIGEGESGAAFCRECGQPFLTLDARRSTFCNDRERFRHNARARRQRLRTITVTAGSPDDERLDELVEQHDREHPPGAEA